MNKTEVMERIMNSQNGGLYAAVAGIVIVYGIDRITKSHYRVEMKQDSFVMEPSSETEDKPDRDKPENEL